MGPQWFLFFMFPAVMLEKFCNMKRIRSLTTVKIGFYLCAFFLWAVVFSFGKPISINDYEILGTIIWGLFFLIEIIKTISDKNRGFVSNYAPLFLSCAIWGGWIYYAFFFTT